MNRKKLVALTLMSVACSDSSDPLPAPDDGADMSKYVAMGTSVTMGYASDGVVGSSQQASWPKVLANDVGVAFTLPTIDTPGCRPPLVTPLIGFRRADGSSATSSTVCSGNVPGTVLPAQNVAIAGATATSAVSETSGNSSTPLTTRVLAPGMTQVTAMRSLNPTFVSVEFGANELLPALNGQVTSATTVASFSASYATIIDNVRQSGAQAVLALLPTDLVRFPAVRTAAEIASQRSAFAALNVAINANCNTSTNIVSLPGLVVSALASGALRASLGLGPFNLSCADVPGTADGILTPADMTALNSLAVQMNSFINAKASESGYATFSLGALYDTAKDGVPFDLSSVLTSNAPFGARISLDGVHPSAAGQIILAGAARSAIIAKYGSITK